MDRHEIKSEKTVKSWIKNGLIPGAHINAHGKWIIPATALPPYTAARAHNSPGILKSILSGVCKRRQVLPALYHMSCEEFEVYICELVKCKLITKKTINGIDYYYPTLKGEEYVRDRSGISGLLKQLAPAIEAAAKGGTDSLLSRIEKG